MRVTVILSAPSPLRWFESTIAGMIGQTMIVDGEAFEIVASAPTDGEREIGTSAMQLILEGPL